MKRAIVLFVLGMVLLSSAPAWAVEPTKAAVRFNVGYFTATGDLKPDPDTKVKYEGSLGIGVGFEWKFTELFGLEGGLKYFKPDVKEEVSGLEVAKEGGEFMPLTVAALFHLTPKSSFDFFIGPELAYVFYGDTTFFGETIKYKDEFTWGAKAGVDIPLSGSQWGINANVEYIDARSETDLANFNNEKLNPKPIIITAGAVLRF